MKTVNSLTLAEITLPENTSRRDAWDGSAPHNAELTASVGEKGLLQPVIVRKILDGYELVAGFRRYHAAQDAGLESIPVVVGEYTDREAAAVNIAENLLRKDLSPIDKAVGMDRLKKKGWKQKDIATAYHCTPAYVSQLLTIIKKLDGDNIERMHNGELSVQAALEIINPKPKDESEESEEETGGGGGGGGDNSEPSEPKPSSAGSKELAQALAEIEVLQQEQNENMECFRRLTELAKGLKDRRLGQLMFDLMSYSCEDADEKIRQYLGKK